MGQLSAVRRQLLMNVSRFIRNCLVGRIEWKRSIAAGAMSYGVTSALRRFKLAANPQLGAIH